MTYSSGFPSPAKHRGTLGPENRALYLLLTASALPKPLLRYQADTL